MSNTINTYTRLQNYLTTTTLTPTTLIKSSFYLKAEIGCCNVKIFDKEREIENMFWDCGTGDVVTEEEYEKDMEYSF